MLTAKQQLLLLLLLPLTNVVVDARVRGSLLGDNNGDNSNNSYSTVTTHSNDLISCNAHLHSEPCTTTWSQLFGTKSIHTDTVVIPCGKCIVMDFGIPENDKPTSTELASLPKYVTTTSSAELTLESGLDIQGKLVFHDGYGLDLITPQIVVQGELNVATWTTSQQLVASSSTGYQPTLNITFHEPMEDRPGSGTATTSYMRGNKAMSASSDGSRMTSPGIDRFVVAGGKVIVRGNHDGAHQNSWMIVNDSDNAKKVLLGWVAPVSQGPVEDVDHDLLSDSTGDEDADLTITSVLTHMNTDYLSSYVPPRPRTNGDEDSTLCKDYLKTGILFDYDFSVLHTAASKKPKLRSSGSYSFVKQGELFNKIHDSNDGPEIPFLDGGMEHCLEINRPYLVTARVEMPRNEQTKFTKCAKSGEDCVSLLTTTEQYTNNITHWEEQESHQTLYGNILTVATTIAFRGDEKRVLIRGGPKGIHVLSFTIRLPPKYSFLRRNEFDNGSDLQSGVDQLDEASFPSQTEVAYCPDLVPPNGNAEEAGLHPFPFGTNNPFTHIVVEEDDSDQSIDGNINHYFAISGRRYSMHVFNPDLDDFKASGLSWDIPTPCLIKPHQTGARYR